jgi:hypothetical protein
LVKFPEIWTEPSNAVKEAAAGSTSGADCTTPSSSMPITSWKYFSAMAFQPVVPWAVSLIPTTHWPSAVLFATAFFTM